MGESIPPCRHASALDRAAARTLELFRGLTETALDEVIHTVQVHHVSAGTRIFGHGDEAASLFALLDGRIKMVQVTPKGQQVVLDFINPGETFGCIVMLGLSRYPGTAVAVVDSKVASWSARTIANMMRAYPILAENAMRSFGGRLLETQSRLREISTERVERRIANALLRLVRQSGHGLKGRIQVQFPIGRQDIADLTGATLYTVSRVLSAWEQEGVLEGGRRRILIRDPDRLARIAEDSGK